MSAQSVESVLSKAMSDTAFADALFADPAKALAGFDLTAEEAASFKDLRREDLSKMAQASPEDRVSFGWLNHNQSALSVK
jgi:hypothetical protein